MAAGLPVVAGAAGGAVTEIMDGGRAALLVPPGDPGALARALGELAASPARRRELGAMARRRVEDVHRIEGTVAAHQALYDELLGGGGA
jgi:glycosyltransferase involved in cell wall biosynthesis